MHLAKFIERTRKTFGYSLKDIAAIRHADGFVMAANSLNRSLDELAACQNWGQFREVRGGTTESHFDAWSRLTLDAPHRVDALSCLEDLCQYPWNRLSQHFDLGLYHDGHPFHGVVDEELNRRPVYFLAGSVPEGWSPRSTGEDPLASDASVTSDDRTWTDSDTLSPRETYVASSGQSAGP
jgi:hypothetical protein